MNYTGRVIRGCIVSTRGFPVRTQSVRR